MTSSPFSPDWVASLPAAKDADQLFVVAGMGENLTTATISLHQRDGDGRWRVLMTSPGFVGMHGLGKAREGDDRTPVGVFTITHRFSGQMGGFGTCFLGLNVPWGNYGIHGTNKPESIGYSASHGCIRMGVRDAEELYALVPDGTRVVIECGPYGELGGTLRVLKNGDRSSAVRAVQRKLKALSFYHGWPDGIFGAATQQAVDAARNAYGLPPNGMVDWALYQALGLTLFE